MFVLQRGRVFVRDLAHGLSTEGFPGDDRQKVWSNPGLGRSFSREPIRTGLRRSKGVRSTGLTSPVDTMDVKGYNHSSPPTPNNRK